MPASESQKGRILLLGLEDSLATELESILSGQQQEVQTAPFLSPHECVEAVEQAGAELVFCSSERQRYLELLDEVGRRMPELAVVVVSRTPEVSEWLDAIEAGASDYCAAPFESSHIQWILESALKHRSNPILYRAAG
jgi:DNA-binding NtrC family response regulator